jgi:PAS domain S-box-containing protein
MSLVTTQPEMLMATPSTSTALLAGGMSGHPGDGAARDGDLRIERRRHGGSCGSPMEILNRLPAVVVLERFPIPSLAMTRDGIILFANTAFAEMVGYQQDGLAGLAFQEVFQTVPAALCALSGVDALANLVVELRHCEGWTVRARMSKSALMRRDDPVVLVTFEDLTERLWIAEH